MHGSLPTSRKAIARSVTLSYLAALLVGLMAMAAADAWRAGLSGADEPAHFLNAWFMANYAQHAAGANPIAYAAEYYLHYPKISIGHWPPAYYALLAPFFLVLPATPATAFALNLLISALPAALAALVLARLYDWTAGVLGALLAAMTPVLLEANVFLMVDAPLAAATLGAAILWCDYVAKGGAWRVFAFALVSAFAVLMKGNGWLLLFLPPLHLALTGRWRVLRALSPWAAGLLAAIIVGPWYWLTAGIAADGFNYQPGFAYAAEALWFNFGTLVANGGPALLLAGYGLHVAWAGRAERPTRWLMLAGMAALVLATLILQSLVPVDLEPRYMAPALPPLLVLAVAGLIALRRRARWIAAAAALAVAAPGAAHLVTREAKIDLRLGEAAAMVPGHPTAWLIDGTSGAEGAFIAELALRDPSLRSYAVRSSKLLARSNFMGSDYALATRDPAEVLARLRMLGVEGVVISRIGGKPAFPHSALLRRALASPASPYRYAATLPHRNRPGATEIYVEPGVRPNAEAIRAFGLPDKADALTP